MTYKITAAQRALLVKQIEHLETWLTVSIGTGLKQSQCMTLKDWPTSALTLIQSLPAEPMTEGEMIKIIAQELAESSNRSNAEPVDRIRALIAIHALKKSGCLLVKENNP